MRRRLLWRLWARSATGPIRITAAALAAAALIAAGLAVFPSPRSPAQLETAELAHTALKVAAVGRVEPYSEAIELAVGLIGALKAVYVAEGDGVRIGQLLAELNNADQQARVAQAEATARLSRPN